jgi:ATP-dependent Zn protease
MPEDYHSVRITTALKSILWDVAGTVADAELSGGNGRIPADDLRHAQKTARLIAGADDVDKLIFEKYAEAQRLVAGPYRAEIETIAQTLLTKKTLQETELKALCQGVRQRLLAKAGHIAEQ